MTYAITTVKGRTKIMMTVNGVADVVENITGRFGERVNIVHMLHDLISQLEHVTRVDDVWLTVTPVHH